MFINKLVCDKCGTEVSTGDKFCRECGEKGTSLGYDDIKKKFTQSMMVRCRTCGELFTHNSLHACKSTPKFYDENIKLTPGICTNTTKLL